MSEANNTNSGVCPHCKAAVDPLRAPAVSVIGGRIVHFCSALCREQHLERTPEPEKKAPETKPPRQTESSAFQNPSDQGANSSQTAVDSDAPRAALGSEDIEEVGAQSLPMGPHSSPDNPRASKKGASPLLRNRLLLLGMTAGVTAAALWSWETDRTMIGQLAVLAGAFVLCVLGTLRGRRAGPMRVLESWAVPLTASAVALSHGLGARASSWTIVVGAAVLLVDQLGRTLELMGRARSRVLGALEGRSDVAIPGSWKDNSPIARRLRWITVPLEWARYPVAAAVGAGVSFWGEAGAQDAITAGAIALVGLSPRALKMATGDAHLSVGIKNLAAGVFMRDAHVVDKVADSTTVTLMASRTVIEGEPRAMDLKLAAGADRDTVLGLLLALNAEIPGRIAAGIRHWLVETGATPPPNEMIRVEKLPGLGLRGALGGREILSGDRRLLLSKHVSTARLEDHAHRIEQTGRRAVFVSVDDSAVACFALEDPISVHAAPAVAAIRALGIEPVLVTSAGVDAGTALAARLGIEIVEFDKDETEVGAVIRRLEQAGDQTVLVGRGHAFEDDANTSAASIALGHRDQTIAGIVTADENIGKVPFILASCRRARASVATNIAVACSCLGLGVILSLGWIFPASVLVAAALHCAAGISSTINGPYPAVQRFFSLPSKWLLRLRRPAATSD